MKNYVPFYFTTYLALKIMVEYENKREIDLDTLRKYRQNLLKTITKIYQNEKKRAALVHKTTIISNGEILFEDINENEELAIFLKENSNICYLEGNVLKLYDEVTEEEIEYELNECNYQAIMIRNACMIYADDLSNLEILGLNKIRNSIENYLITEKELLDEYQKLATHQESENIIQKINFLSYFIDLFIKKLSCLDTTELRKHSRLIHKKKLAIEGEYEEQDELKQDTFRTAIFSNNPIFCSKSSYYIFNILNIKEAKDGIFPEFEMVDYEEFDMYEEDIDDDQETNYEDDYEEDDDEFFEDEEYENYNEDNYLYQELMLIEEEYRVNLYFYLRYIEKINKYLQEVTYDEVLETVKYRLLYILDKYHYKLLDEINFNKILSYCEKNITLTRKSIKGHVIEPKILVSQIFSEEFNDLTIRKLLYLSTYYDLTKDIKLKEMLKRYKYNKNYEQYYKIIFSEEENNLSDKKGKTLTK